LTFLSGINGEVMVKLKCSLVSGSIILIGFKIQTENVNVLYLTNVMDVANTFYDYNFYGKCILPLALISSVTTDSNSNEQYFSSLKSIKTIKGQL